MKSIEPVHSKRVSVALNELTIGQTQELCKIPARYEQRTITEFLRAITQQIPRPDDEPAVTDPIMWSVNERMNVTIFYMAAMLDDGPNFALGDLNLSDYLLSGADYLAEVPFEFEGEAMVFSPLHGYQAEVIEALIVTGQFESTFLNWNAGYMAACMRAEADEPLTYKNPAQYQKDLAEKMHNILNIPESTFTSLFAEFIAAATSAQHFVNAIVTEHGVIAQQVTDPLPVEEGEVPLYGVARFRARSAISEGARNLVAPAHGAEVGAGAVLRPGSDNVQPADPGRSESSV